MGRYDALLNLDKEPPQPVSHPSYIQPAQNQKQPRVRQSPRPTANPTGRPVDEPTGRRTDEPVPRPTDRSTGRRMPLRRGFEFYEDQLASLKQISLQEQLAGKSGNMSQMVREAIDDYLKKRASKK